MLHLQESFGGVQPRNLRPPQLAFYAQINKIRRQRGICGGEGACYLLGDQDITPFPWHVYTSCMKIYATNVGLN